MKKYLVKDNDGWLGHFLFNNIEEVKNHINDLFHCGSFENVSHISILELDLELDWITEIEKVYKNEQQQVQSSDMKYYSSKVTLIRSWLERTGFTKNCQTEKIVDDWYLLVDDPNKALLLTLWNSVRELDDMCKRLTQNLLNIETDEEEEIDL